MVSDDRQQGAGTSGKFTVKGTNRGVGLFELAARHGAIADAADPAAATRSLLAALP